MINPVWLITKFHSPPHTDSDIKAKKNPEKADSQIKEKLYIYLEFKKKGKKKIIPSSYINGSI